MTSSGHWDIPPGTPYKPHALALDIRMQDIDYPDGGDTLGVELVVVGGAAGVRHVALHPGLGCLLVALLVSSSVLVSSLVSLPCFFIHRVVSSSMLVPDMSMFPIISHVSILCPCVA